MIEVTHPPIFPAYRFATESLITIRRISQRKGSERVGGMQMGLIHRRRGGRSARER
jgi:hypothetical protein